MFSDAAVRVESIAYELYLLKNCSQLLRGAALAVLSVLACKSRDVMPLSLLPSRCYLLVSIDPLSAFARVYRQVRAICAASVGAARRRPRPSETAQCLRRGPARARCVYAYVRFASESRKYTAVRLS